MKTIGLLILLIVVSVIPFACDKQVEDPKGACGNGYKDLDFTIANVQQPFQTYVAPIVPGNRIQIFYQSSGLVQFIAGKNVNDVCSKEHMSIHFRALSSSDRTDYPPSTRVYGEALFGAAIRTVVMTFDKNNREWIGGLDVGLDQQFKDKPGDVDIYTTVEFQSLGSRALDSAFFVDRFDLLGAICKYSLH